MKITTSTPFKMSAVAAAVSMASASAVAAPCDTGSTVVTSLADNETCDGLITLREAIRNANENSDESTITFSGAASSGTITLTSELPIIDEDVIITGPGATNLTIAGQDSVSYAFYSSSYTSMSIEGLTITDTSYSAIQSHGPTELEDVTVTGSGNNNMYGGAVKHTSEDDLIITDSHFENNTGSYGGAILSYYGDLTISGSTLINNYSDAHGGAINTWDANVTIVDSEISNNESDGSGGGVHIYSSYGSSIYHHTLTVIDSTIDNNYAGSQGGGIATTSYTTSINITNTTISNNIAYSYGGGIASVNAYNGYSANPVAQITITDSVITNNDAINGPGGGFMMYGSYGIADFHLVRSEVSDNTSDSEGGGIWLYAFYTGGEISIESSTLTGNNSGDDGGALATYGGGQGYGCWGPMSIKNSTLDHNNAASYGGAISLSSGCNQDLVIVNTTIADNTADYGAGIAGLSYGPSLQISHSTITGNHAREDGGGIHAKSYGQHVISNSVLAGNTSAGDNPDWNDYNDNSYDVEINDSFIGSIDGLDNAGWDDGGGNQTGTNGAPLDPMLGALMDNGGYTQTMMPETGSPLIDAGQETFTPLELQNLPDTDQRGSARVADGGVNGDRIDIGAVEANSAPFFDASQLPVGGIEVDEGVVWSLDLDDFFVDPEGGSITYSAFGLPGGLSLNGSNGEISGIPEAGTYTVTVYATDSGGETIEQEIEISVLAEEQDAGGDVGGLAGLGNYAGGNSSSDSGGYTNGLMFLIMAPLLFFRRRLRK